MNTYEEKITKICGKGVSNYVVDLSVVVVFKAFYIGWTVKAGVNITIRGTDWIQKQAAATLYSDLNYALIDCRCSTLP